MYALHKTKLITDKPTIKKFVDEIHLIRLDKRPAGYMVPRNAIIIDNLILHVDPRPNESEAITRNMRSKHLWSMMRQQVGK